MCYRGSTGGKGKHSEMESKTITNGRFGKADKGDTLSQPTKSLSISIVERIQNIIGG